jgi:two-component system cell cycle sensor histidine kinase/response regulator CckA
MSFALAPETWRSDLLRIVLRVAAVLGGILYLPSVFTAVKFGMNGVVVLDTVAIAAIIALSYFDRIPGRLRASCACFIFYTLGVGLMIGVGSISQIYLFVFSLLTTLLLSFRWGLATVALNAATMLAVGYVGIASPEMVVPRWTVNLAGWSVITVNFAMANVSLVLALGAVISALERALARSVAAREALEHERKELVKLNQSLEQEVRERARSEESLRESKALLRIAGTTARLGGWRVDVGGEHAVWSEEACEIHDLPAGTTPTLAEAIAFYAPEWREAICEALGRCIRDGTPFDVEAEVITAKGARLWVRAIGNAVRNAAGRVAQVHGSMQDITPRKLAQARHDKLEEQFRQAQKMETFGNLAGGVAHDFNNLMSVVLSYSEMLADDLEEDDPMRADLDEIRGAGRRATDLTRQLLAFSRQQVLQPKVVDLAGIVSGMEKMLRRLIGEDVELTASCTPGLGSVLVDPGQIEQVIMNLVVNARDAMPLGGMITIETAAVVLDEHHASEHVGVRPGPHVMLAVSDTGTGMDKATQAHMFEPFFTTKEKEKGTGLGLATVFGIVQQSGGTIWVYSEPGKGTTFKVYFPVAEGAANAHAAAPIGDRGTLRGSETILLVEDEDRVRGAARTILRKYGYNVLEAQSGGDALLLCEQHAGTIDLLLTDVVMPRMSGRVLAERLFSIRPEMKVLYMSGYTDDAVVRHGILDATLAFIQKPITPEPLARKVREVLGRGEPTSNEPIEIR